MTAVQCTYLILRCDMTNVLDSPCKNGRHFLPLGRWEDGAQGSCEMSDSVPVPLQYMVPCNEAVMTFAPSISHARLDNSIAMN